MPIICQLVRQEIKDISDDIALLAWTKKKRVTLEEANFNEKAKLDLIKLLWVYQNVEAIMLKDIPSKNLIIY